MKGNGVAEPRSEIKHLAYFNGSNVNVSYATRRIIEKYYEIKKSMPEYVQVRCSHCGAALNIVGLAASVKCEYCGTVHFRKGRVYEN